MEATISILAALAADKNAILIGHFRHMQTGVRVQLAFLLDHVVRYVSAEFPHLTHKKLFSAEKPLPSMAKTDQLYFAQPVRLSVSPEGKVLLHWAMRDAVNGRSVPVSEVLNGAVSGVKEVPDFVRQKYNDLVQQAKERRDRDNLRKRNKRAAKRSVVVATEQTPEVVVTDDAPPSVHGWTEDIEDTGK